MHANESRGVGGWTPFRVGWLTILVVTVSARAYTLSSWSFLQDDLLVTSAVPDRGLVPFMFQDIAGHVFPGELLFVWIATKLDPLDFTVFAVSICFFAGLVVIGWGLALREIFGERLPTLIPLVIITLTPGATMVSLWWISAVNVLPMQASMGFCVWFLARHLRHGRRRSDLIGLTGSYALGLFMWEKSLLLMVVLAFVCLLLVAGPMTARIRVAARALWPATAVSILYIGLYLLAVRGSDSGSGDPTYERSVGTASTLVTRGLLDIVLPAFVGGPFTGVTTSGDNFPPTPSGVTLLVWAAVVLLVGLALLHRRRAGVAVLMVVTYAAVCWGLVFFSDRFLTIGPVLTTIPRYSSDLIAVVALGGMFLAMRTVFEDGPALRGPIAPRTSTLVQQALVAYLVVLSATTAITTGRVWDQVADSSTKPFMDNLVGDARLAGRASVVDARVPREVVDPILLPPASFVSAILSPLSLPLRFDQPAERLLALAPDGHLRDVAVVDGVTSVGPGPDGDCGFAVDAGQSTRVPLSGDLFEFSWGVELTYFAASDAGIAVSTGGDRVELDVPKTAAGDIGTRQLVVDGPVTSLSIDGLSGSDAVCVTQVRVGRIEPTSTGPGAPPDQ